MKHMQVYFAYSSLEFLGCWCWFSISYNLYSCPLCRKINFFMMSLVSHRRENCFRVLGIVYLEQKRCLCASKSTLFYGYVVYGCAEITLIFF